MSRKSNSIAPRRAKASGKPAMPYLNRIQPAREITENTFNSHRRRLFCCAQRTSAKPAILTPANSSAKTTSVTIPTTTEMIIIAGITAPKKYCFGDRPKNGGLWDITYSVLSSAATVVADKTSLDWAAEHARLRLLGIVTEALWKRQLVSGRKGVWTGCGRGTA